MNTTEKQIKIYQSVNDFFTRSMELKENGTIKKFFQFLKKTPNHAPFNNALVFIQNPDCWYYATAKQWENRFNRTIKEEARPMVILFPFWPVEFVYDFRDTEWPNIAEDDILFRWKEKEGNLDEKVFNNIYKNLYKLNITLNSVEIREYLSETSFHSGGFAQHTFADDKLSITLHPRYSKESIEAYWVLCHEIAHILLGHLRNITIEKKWKKWEFPKKIEIVKDRTNVSSSIKELEAELVARIVFNNMWIEKNSELYIASWTQDMDDFNKLWMSEVLKVAGKILDMWKKNNVFGI